MKMTNVSSKDTSDIKAMLPILYCQAIDFFDKLDELYIGQVLIVSRYSKEKKDIINEVWIREGNTTYKKINKTDSDDFLPNISNMNGDEINVIIR